MRVAPALAAVALALAPTTARADATTIRFPFEDARYLERAQHDGASVHVPDAARRADGPLPLVVFLHGVNPSGRVHLWMGGLFDLRPLVDGLARAHPFLFAAPSQTRDATDPKTLWQDFDVDAFVAQTETALAGASAIDRDHVYVIGHSGAGCNTDGGLARAAGAHVTGVVAIDTCLDEEIGGAFARLPELWVMWQSKTWWRDIEAFKRGLGGAPARIDRLTLEGPAPHDEIVIEGLRRFAHEWL